MLIIPYKNIDQWKTDNNMLLVLSSFGLVHWCVKHPFNNKVVNFLSTSILSIYLITDSWYFQPRMKYILDIILNNWFLGFGLVVLICIVCLCIDKIRFYLFELIEKCISFLINKIKLIR